MQQNRSMPPCTVIPQLVYDEVGEAIEWGKHRQGGFRDPFGHNWSVGHHSPLAPRTARRSRR